MPCSSAINPNVLCNFQYSPKETSAMLVAKLKFGEKKMVRIRCSNAREPALEHASNSELISTKLQAKVPLRCNIWKKALK